MEIFDFLKTNRTFCAPNGFALNHDKSLQIRFFCAKRQAKKDFLKDVESTVAASIGLYTSNVQVKT